MFDIMPYRRRGSLVSGYDPFRDMEEFEKHFFGNSQLESFKTDIKDNGKDFVVEMDLPGFKKDEISASLENGYLTISASKGLDKDEEKKDGKYIRKERYAGAMSRSFFVGEDLTQEDIKAKYEDGILKLSVPKKEKAPVKGDKYIAIEG